VEAKRLVGGCRVAEHSCDRHDALDGEACGGCQPRELAADESVSDDLIGDKPGVGAYD
jgi:hypothetical protein